MKRKTLIASVILPVLAAAGAMGQVVNFHDASNGQLAFPGVGYNQLFNGQGAYSDPGNDIWNGFGFSAGYQSTYFYSGSPGGSPPWPQPAGNPGNPYAAFNSGAGFVTSTGSSLFDFATGSTTISGNATSSGAISPVTLTVANYVGDNGFPGGAFSAPDVSPPFLLGECAVNNGASPNEVFTLGHVPAGTYGLILYGANYDNNRGTSFAVSSGTAHNGISATLNSNASPAPSPTFVEGQNFVVFENVTPDGSGNITITASPNPQDGVGNGNLSGETDVNGFQLIANPPPTALNATRAQNVPLGGTASFSFTPAFAPSPTFHWQFVQGGVTNTLADGVSGGVTTTGSTTSNLTLGGVSAASAGLYQCVIATATKTNTSTPALLTILSGTATNILSSTDSISDFGASIPALPTKSVAKAIDGSLYEYVNYGLNGSNAPFVGPVGIIVTPVVGETVVTGLRVFTSGDHPEADPADYLLEGSLDGGATFTPVSGGLLGLPAQRNLYGGAINVTNQVFKEVDFANTSGYTTYRVTFTNVNNSSAVLNGLQLGEIQLVGGLAPIPPGFAQQPAANAYRFVGGTLQSTVVPTGPGPFTYAWHFNGAPQTITGATNATLTITNLASGNAGSYTCVVGNPYGSTTSSALTLTVATPTAYQQQLLSLKPIAYWPMNEITGTNAYDNVASHDGTYVGGVSLADVGVPTAGFGSPSYSALFDGTTGYLDIPEGPFNITGAMTVIAWVSLGNIGGFDGLVGHGDSSWRMSINQNGNPGANDGGGNDATSPNSIHDNNFHMVAFSYSGVAGAGNGLLYVDGVSVASKSVGTNLAGNTLDVWVGGAPDYGTGRLLNAAIAHVAIFTNGLSAAQIQGLFSSGGVPPTVTLVTNQVSVNQNQNVGFPTTITGTGPFTYTWFSTDGVNALAIPGATNRTLTLTNVQPAAATLQYYVVASSAYGTSTSGLATLVVNTGAPVLVGDISPLQVSVPVGTPVTFTVSVTGTAPFTYTWFLNGGTISGATNSSYAFAAGAGASTYSCTISNVSGSIGSSVATVTGLTTAPPVIGFNTNGTDWTLNTGGFTPTLVNNVLTLTANGGGQSSSAFYNFPQYIGGFVASFTYTATGSADGTTFCLQNDPTGPSTPVGGGGGALGYTGITPSAAFELNLYAGSPGGTGIQFGVDGGTPASGNTTPAYISDSPVVLASGHPINVVLYYNGNTLNAQLRDATSGNSFQTTFAVGSLPAILGSEVAYVGFTGACGGLAASQAISNFAYTYTTTPVLSLAKGAGAGSVVVSWPVSVAGTFVLQQAAPSLASGWNNVSTTPTVVNGQNQVTLTPGTTSAFYRLQLQ